MSVHSKESINFTFPLMKLPFLPLELIVKLMNIEDIIRLTMTSKCLKQLIIIMKLDVPSFHVHFKKGSHTLEINRTKDDFCDVIFGGNEENEVIGTYDPAKWLKFSEPSNVLHFFSTDFIDDVLAVSNCLRSYFTIYFSSWKLYPEKLKSMDVKELISKLDFESRNRFWVLGGSIETEPLSYLMDKIGSKMKLKITSNVKSDFSHKKAFSFSEMEYHDAKWITLDDLKSLKNINSLSLKSTSFDNEDINKLLHHWSDSNDDMFKKLEVKLKEGITVNKTVVLNNFLSFLSDEKPENDVSYILATQRSKNRSLARLVSLDTTIQIEMLSSDGRRATSILELQHRKRQLSLRYSAISKEEIAWLNEVCKMNNDSLEKRELNEKIQEAKNEKKTLQKEFDKVVKDLEALDVENFISSIDEFH